MTELLWNCVIFLRRVWITLYWVFFMLTPSAKVSRYGDRGVPFELGPCVRQWWKHLRQWVYAVCPDAVSTQLLHLDTALTLHHLNPNWQRIKHDTPPCLSLTRWCNHSHACLMFVRITHKYCMLKTRAQANDILEQIH